MAIPSNSADIFQLYHHSLNPVTGGICWYGNDYLSFTETLHQIVQRMKANHLKKKVEIVISIPDQEFSVQQLEQWKNNYCAEQALLHEAEYRLMKRQGYQFLWKGLLFLWICLSIVYLIDQYQPFGEYLKLLGKETILFLGWVILWKPIEMIVFEPWAEHHQIKLYKKLQQTTLTVTHANRI